MVLDPKRQIPPGEMTANVQWLDALLRHQIFILRTAGSVRNDVTALLNATEKDIADRIRKALQMDPAKLTQRLKRAEKLIEQIRAVRNKAWDKVDEEWIATMTEFVKGETTFLKNTLELVVPVEIAAKLPSISTLRSLIKDRPFEGKVLKDWAKKIRRDDIDRIAQQVRIGIVQGESSQVIARRVVGTAQLRGRDGVTQITRRNAEAISRTAIIHFSDAARNEFLMANADFFENELFVATLDSRTTPVCRKNDGQIFPLGIGPRPPLHWNCRSLRVAIINNQVIGWRPAKPVTQRMLLREFCQQNGIRTVSARQYLPYGYMTKFDSFARRRIREMTGQVPAKVSYGEWLGRQSREFQDDVLGITRGRLFRRGGVTLDQFVDRTGREIPLSRLAETEASAFRSAGLDPEKFLLN